MRVKRFRVAVWLLLSSAGFCLSLRVQAVALAESRIGFSNLQISPMQGTLQLPTIWSLEAFAEAKNSLGELDQKPDQPPFINAASLMSGFIGGNGPPECSSMAEFY